MVRSLVEHGYIQTSKARAKEVRRLADKYISSAKKGDVATRRKLHTVFGKRDVVNTLVDRIAPAMKDRVSGFTTIKVVGKRRGDNTELVRLELVNQPERTGTLKAEKKAKPAKVAKKAKTATKKETKKTKAA